MPGNYEAVHPVALTGQGILRALLAAPLEGIDTFTGLLHHRLSTDLRFRYQCGLSLEREAPPSTPMRKNSPGANCRLRWKSLKSHLTADSLHVHGIEKVTIHLYLNAIRSACFRNRCDPFTKSGCLKNERSLNTNNKTKNDLLMMEDLLCS